MSAERGIGAEAKPEPAKVTVPVEVTVPEEWIELLTKYNDMFMRDYCGYWMRGVERGPDGWLAWEDDEEHMHGEEPNGKAARRAWKAGEALPEGWYRLDRDAAIRAYVEGVKRWGVGWYDGDTSEHSDANGYDVVIQLALLGEIRYG